MKQNVYSRALFPLLFYTEAGVTVRDQGLSEYIQQFQIINITDRKYTFRKARGKLD
jgi:hypothetical protein